MKLRIWLTISSIFILSLSAKSVHACYVCFSQAADDPHNIALSKSIMFLLCVILFVMLIIGKFCWSVRQREKMMLNNDEGVM